jgi:hypothetical protein
MTADVAAHIVKKDTLRKIMLSGNADVIEALAAKLREASEITTKEQVLELMDQLVKLIREDQ